MSSFPTRPREFFAEALPKGVPDELSEQIQEKLVHRISTGEMGRPSTFYPYKALQGSWPSQCSLHNNPSIECLLRGFVTPDLSGISLSGESLNSYDLKIEKGVDGKRLAAYCNVCSFVSSSFDVMGLWHQMFCTWCTSLQTSPNCCF